MAEDPNRETMPPMTGVANADEDVAVASTPEEVEEELLDDEDEDEQAPGGAGPV